VPALAPRRATGWNSSSTAPAERTPAACAPAARQWAPETSGPLRFLPVLGIDRDGRPNPAFAADSALQAEGEGFEPSVDRNAQRFLRPFGSTSGIAARWGPRWDKTREARRSGLLPDPRAPPAPGVLAPHPAQKRGSLRRGCLPLGLPLLSPYQGVIGERDANPLRHRAGHLNHFVCPVWIEAIGRRLPADEWTSDFPGASGSCLGYNLRVEGGLEDIGRVAVFCSTRRAGSTRRPSPVTPAPTLPDWEPASAGSRRSWTV
jgi:hypothetical protein